VLGSLKNNVCRADCGNSRFIDVRVVLHFQLSTKLT
jgi:hypothetical protein